MATASHTSASLLEQARGDEQVAWEKIARLYTPLLHAWLSSASLQLADRDDLTQRALMILVRQLPDFHHNGRPGAFRAWLRGITINLLREFWRDRPGGAADSVLDQLADPAGGLSRLWDEQHDRHVLHGLMEQIRPEFTAPTWLAFRRIALDGAVARTVAAETGLSVNAVLIAKSRVLARLRQAAAGLVD
jgi:RNA polymerase sigma-70 factor (ECF subfamily)